METQPQKQIWTNRKVIEDRFRIRNKRGEIVQFKLNKAQEYYESKKTRRNLILKARQKGISKYIDSDQLVDCMRKPTVAVVISHEKESTTRLFESMKEILNNAKKRPTTSIDSKSMIKFPVRGSTYFIGTAGAKAFGRGDTVHRAHLSEAAFYPNLERILNGIAEACEYGQIDIETTPNGREEFYEMWQKAKAGLSSYTPIFIPWFIDGEYSADSLTEVEKKGLSKAVWQMFEIPDKIFMQTLDDEEKRLVERVKKEWDIEMTAGMLKWRRYKIWDKGIIFFQEYPEDDVSCFLQAGRSVFGHIVTDTSRRIPLDDLDSWKVDDKIKELLLGRRLYGGLDGAAGSLGGDSHCFAVMDADDKRYDNAAIIFEIHGNEPIDIFDAKVAKIMKKYHIQLGVENNGIGKAHVLALRRLEVEVYEWETTGVSRPVMMSDLEEVYRKESLIETVPEAENEARDMEYKNDRPEHKTGKHDDRVFARAIAIGMRNIPETGIEFL